MKKVIHKTVITVEILHEHPIHIGSYSLWDIHNIIDEGDWIGQISTKSTNIPKKGKKAVKAVNDLGSSPDFFMMDENGNDIDF